ncbi:hypothetical protein [Xenorhabdus innexi]|uniref:CHAT domain-containing protein n=1 Tax=Xenorhabdus innexi TaxID=290109 RepID=A0A1N6MUL1_9GAMM|nr:hypothetical protein [Xenorhabdus innexi]PHM35843.1 hypothetical protein Xinn_02095 [Xenorhabdus innexi]SIP72546.1 hypothetical protein XIS1_1560018 [Xenorhabdus innexi]
MSWEKVFILLCSSDGHIYSAADAARRRYRVRPSRCYASLGMTNFLPLNSNPPPFRHCDLNSKLLIFAHGTVNNTIYIDGEGEFNGRQLAELLISCGLKNIGLVSIKACRSGLGNLLTTFVHNFRNRARIGWAIGYKGDIISIPWSQKHIYMSPLDVCTRILNYKMPDSYRITIVEGNTRVVHPDSRRYSHFTGVNLIDFDDD